MSFKDLTVSLSEKFNWLASPPDRHFTMGEAINWITDGELARGPDIQWNRAGRFVDRATMVVGLGVTAAVCLAESSFLPILLVPVVFKGVAFVAAGITEGIVNKMAAAAETLERLTTEREYKKANKKDLPRGVR